MPLFFLISGMSAHYPLSKQTNGQYVSEKLKRLVVPLVFGMLVILPPQVYVYPVYHSSQSGRFANFLPHYFESGIFPRTGMHL